MKIISRDKYEELTNVSVSKIYDLITCPFRMVIDQSISFDIFLPNHQAILGSTIHKVHQYSNQINNSNDFEKEWNKALNIELDRNSKTQKLKEDFDWHCKNYYLKKQQVKEYILNKSKKIFKKSLTPSKEVLIGGKYIKGKPDYFIIDGNYLLLKDFKSGKIFQSNGLNNFVIKKEIEAQLMIYCGLICEQNTNIKKADIYVVDNSGQEYQIKKKIDECIQLLQKTRLTIENANNHITTKNYSEIALKNDNCNFCNGRYFCPHFKSFVEDGMNKGIIDVVGELKKIIKTKTGWDIKIEDNESSKRIININGKYIEEQKLKSLLSDQIVVFNTRKSKNEETTYYGTRNTTIFKSLYKHEQ